MGSKSPKSQVFIYLLFYLHLQHLSKPKEDSLIMPKIKIGLQEDGTYRHNYSLPKPILHNLMRAKKAVMKHNQSVVLITDGNSGVGKTTLSFQQALFLDPNFNLDKVAWSVDKFIDLIQNANKGECIVFDEAMIISGRSAMSLFNKRVTIALSQIRSRNIYIIFNINSIFDLDKNVGIFRANALFHVYQAKGKVDGQRRVLGFNRDRIKKLYHHGKKYYNYMIPKANFFTTFTRYFPFDEQEYERRKRDGSDTNTAAKLAALGKTERKYREGLKLLMYKLLKDKRCKTQKEIIDLTEMTKPTVNRMFLEAEEEFGELK